MKPKQKLIIQTALALITVIITTVFTWVIDTTGYFFFWLMSMIFSAAYLSIFAVKLLRHAKNGSLVAPDKAIRYMRLAWMWSTIGIIVFFGDIWVYNWGHQSTFMYVMTAIMFHLKSLFEYSFWQEFLSSFHILLLTIALLYLSLRLESNQGIAKTE